MARSQIRLCGLLTCIAARIANTSASYGVKPPPPPLLVAGAGVTGGTVDTVVLVVAELFALT